ncbi:glycosyltransferase family 4 protein [Mucilaginibacter psychrotolerans]|uniref:Glycosyltransferase family 1 protein n=1 Tax=Mucilaginibacter psychrotolerans TaxID=1524096 RepID=A0A4Y8S909_9SPHI|nr:glycosyltransferase family 1 protein [Mucilaginibacter psychrotolerans]TFF35519.1 glycosyltransferase family 1 protein [Mucilaginibacter psychrotolerans]
MNVFADGRWAGDTGIGRLYKEVISRTPESINLSVLESDFKLGHPLSPWYLGKQVEQNNSDVFYSPSYMPPWHSAIPFVITIHDLNHLYYYTRFHKLYLKHFIAYLATRAKKVITVSNYTKAEIVKALKLNPGKIEVVYNGVEPVFAANTESLNFGRPYFFYIGNRRGYKNIHRMLAAFAAARIPTDYIIALSGNTDGEIEAAITSLSLNERVKFLGNISEAELPSVYKGAYGLLFVSLMEGFGLPVIEAMASGTPVITSNITSLPEVAGNAALLVNPLETASIATAIEQLVDDSGLHTQLSAAGRRQAGKFCWENTARQTWDIILK